MRPLLSIIMPVYNGENYVAAALESIRPQYADDIELLVLDDGSKDRSVEIVREFANSHKMDLKILTPGRLGNWISITNLGLKEATGEWACFLHHDDLWLPGRMDRLRPEMKSAKGAMVISNSRFVGPVGQYLGEWTCPLTGNEVSSDELLESLLIQNFIGICAPVFKREFVLASGGLDESLWHTADWDLWVRLAAAGPVRFVNESLVGVRVHPESLTVARPINAGEWQQQLSTVVDRYLPALSISEDRKRRVRKTAELSFAVNTALATAVRGNSPHWGALALRFLGIGPFGWHRYLKSSRIVQRVMARLQIQGSLKKKR